MSINFFNSKIFGVTEDFQRAYIVYTYFLRNDINCELINVDRNTLFLMNSMYNSHRYLGQSSLANYYHDSKVMFIIRVHRKDYSSAEKLYDQLNQYEPPNNMEANEK